MALAPSTRLGPYEILSPLGAGGMGEVYRARDPRMGREVAIKLSAERFSDRFEREVRAVAALNHPNICHIYDVGPNYLVMELVEGPTLAEHIKGGALALDEALPIARQIGDALEAAHEKGIVHRDLKPANIKIKPEGVVKVLDFGLAKISEQAAVVGSPEESPTVAMGATIAGQIMGTAAYMSPEQARGKPVDKRADIWAFGVLLYEMLTGRRLFEGETISDTLASVLTKEPELMRVPPKARRLLQRCLEKDPKRRLRDIGDAWQLLEDAPAPTAKSHLHWTVAGALALALAIALWAPWRAAVPLVEHPSVALDLDLGADVSLGSTIGPAVILSPDGARLVFVSRGQDGTPRLFTRRLNEPKAAMLPKTDGAYAPFFSPDGLWVGFFAKGKLKKIRIDGGEPVSLCDAPAGRGASWGEDGNIVAELDSLSFLSLVSADGGRPTRLTELGPGEISHRWPQILPGGKVVLFVAATSYGNMDPSGIAVVSLKDHRKKFVLDHAGVYARYLASGQLVYVTKGSLSGIPFDLERLEVRGVPAMLGEVSSNPTLGSAQYDVSRSGTLAYVAGITEGLRTIQWLDGAGRMEPFASEPALYVYPRLAPDGARLAVIESRGVDADLFVHDQERGGKTRLTNQMTVAHPVWSRDGRFVVFHSAGGMFWTRSDGAGKPQPLTRSTATQMPSSFSPDGARLVFAEVTPAGGAEIRVVQVDSGSDGLRAAEPQSFVKTSTIEVYSSFSPDGRWLAYADAEGGTYEVYVRAFPDRGARTRISNGGGMNPVWSSNGHELFYRSEDQRIMVVNYTVKGGSFVPEKPRLWSGKQLANTGTARNYDLAPDGKRFVVIMSADSAEPRETQSHVTLVVNFFDEVRRRLAGQAK
jgi:serine/threonine-protein kinase